MTFKKNSGNALLYVLLGIALFGALTFVLSRGAEIKEDPLSGERSTLLANELITYAQQITQAVVMMEITGASIDDLDFVLPSEAAWDTAPHSGKVFHPGGGGITPMTDGSKYGSSYHTPREWQYKTSHNVAWTQTTASDLLVTFMDVHPTICAKINDILHGEETVYQITAETNDLFFTGHDSADDFEVADCPDCEGKIMACGSHAPGNPEISAFYVIAASR